MSNASRMHFGQRLTNAAQNGVGTRCFFQDLGQIRAMICQNDAFRRVGNNTGYRHTLFRECRQQIFFSSKCRKCIAFENAVSKCLSFFTKLYPISLTLVAKRHHSGSRQHLGMAQQSCAQVRLILVLVHGLLTTFIEFRERRMGTGKLKGSGKL